MIRPKNIDAEAHTADFRCDNHDASITALDLNAVAEYLVEDAANVGIIVKGSMMDSGTELSDCKHLTLFPMVNGNQDAQDLTTAKTA